MFNDLYSLTKAVLEGRKTMTRRLVQSNNIVEIKTSDGVIHHVDGSCGSYHQYTDKDGKVWLSWSPYKVGEVVAIAQPYKDIINEILIRDKYETDIATLVYKKHKGWNNKMFVRADLMPHRIQITDIKLERLHDISDEDCIKEGITFVDKFLYSFEGINEGFLDANEAFARLIDEISGKGTWESNPFVFAYTFKLVD